MKIYININERYGNEEVESTISDYQELNPDGEFVEETRYEFDVIIEKNRNNEVVAVEKKGAHARAW